VSRKWEAETSVFEIIPWVGMSLRTNAAIDKEATLALRSEVEILVRNEK